MREPDCELMRRIQNGDGNAFDLLFDRYVFHVRSRVGRMIQDKSSVEDIVQETFFRVWTKAGSYAGQGAVGGWVHRIAYNLAVSHIRAVGRSKELPVADAEEDDEAAGDRVRRALEASVPGPEAELERRQLQNMVRQFVSELPESKRDVIRLIHGKDMSVDEAASTLGVPSGTIKSRLYYGRKVLEQRLRDYLSD